MRPKSNIIFSLQKYVMSIFQLNSNKPATMAFLIFLLVSATASAQEYWSPEQVFYGEEGKLTYTPDEQGNIIPDFSNVGYKYGNAAIPYIKTVVEVSPVKGDDGAVIQDAINSLSAISPDKNGFRGAVLLKAGVYHVSGQIKIRESGIVLRGEGDTENGTVIIADGTGKRDLINVTNNESREIIESSQRWIAEDYVPVGRKFVVVSSAAGYEAGDDIVLYRPGTQKWITDIKMDNISLDDDVIHQWKPSSYSLYFERRLTKVSGDTLFFRNPVVMAMEKKYGGGAVYKYRFNRLQNVGIENLCLKSAFESETDEKHSWNAINLNNLENGWVRKVTSWYFSFACVKLSVASKFITVDNCHCREPKSIIYGGRRYSFSIAGSMILVKNCSATEGRHDYSTSSRVCGPNVFTRCSSTNAHADIGPHHRWATGTLYDMIEADNAINVQDRDNMGSGHGWAGANQVFWNCKGASSVCQSPWVSAKNYNFGFRGAKKLGHRPDRPDGEWVGHNVPGIFPISLYEAQRNDRTCDSIIFSVSPQINQINDTDFRMKFTLPGEPSNSNSDKLQLAGPEEIKGEEFTMRLYNYSIRKGTAGETPDSAINSATDNPVQEQKRTGILIILNQ